MSASMLAAATLLAALGAALGAQYRLPAHAAPAHYDLRLLYDVRPASNYSFFGHVDIQLTTLVSTSEIVLHAQDYNILRGMVTLRSAENTVPVANVQLDDTDLLTVSFSETLMAGRNYTLSIPFYGNLSFRVYGPHIISYVNRKTKEQEYLIATLFEAVSARKGFPCFDEPAYKATFRLSIGHNRAFTAIANMPLAASSDDNALESIWPWTVVAEKFKQDQKEFVFDHFHKSVPMSTYLVAWVVSKFAAVESPPGLSHTKFKIWARADAIDQAKYAATIVPKLNNHFEKWFGVPFPLPKQDMVAVPVYGAAGMENWGLIIYLEPALLYDKKQSSLSYKKFVIETIAHELAHQWFGNLVTMTWWSDAWLKEGFTMFAASVGVAAVEPTLSSEDNYAVDYIMAVLALDGLESSHPVSIPVDDPHLINEILDTISYNKGFALVRMMTMFLGNDIFWKGINSYLIKYSYKNADQDDLWRELTAVTEQHGGLTRNVSVKEVMDTWTTQTGFPLLTVTRDYDRQELTISQKRYFDDGRVSGGAAWWVPLRVRCGRRAARAPAPAEWLAADAGGAAQRYRHACGPDDWLLLNADMIAPIRVHYDSRNWQLLARALTSDRPEAVPLLGRVQLLSDALALAWSGRLDYDTALQIVTSLEREKDYLPLSAGLEGLARIERVLLRTPDYGALQGFQRRLVSDAYHRAQKRAPDLDDFNSVKLHVLVTRRAHEAEVPGSEEHAVKLFQQWMSTSDPDKHNPIPLELRSAVYCEALSRGGARHWYFLLARRRAAAAASAAMDMLGALACTRDVWLLAQYLEWAVTDGSEIRISQAVSAIDGVARAPVGYYVARSFIYNRIADIYDKLHGDGVNIILKSILDQFTMQQELDEFLVWSDANKKYLERAEPGVSQGLETARINIAWMSRNRKHVVAMLKEYSEDTVQGFRVLNTVEASADGHRLVVAPLTMCVLVRMAL